MDPSKIPESILRIIQESEVQYPPRGLAILIGNASRAAFSEKNGEGVLKDLAALRDTFTKLNFTVFVLHNFSEAQIKEVVKSIDNLTSRGIAWIPSWKRLVVAYSGSVTRKPPQVGISIESIIDAFVNSVQEELRSIAKLFFLDYSREVFNLSSSATQNDDCILVARGESTLQEELHSDKGDCDAPQKGGDSLTARGGSKLVARGQIPPGRNYLVAYSTQKQMKSYVDNRNGGSYWIQALCEALLRDDLIDCDIEGVLKEVNISLVKEKLPQQPEYISSLNEHVMLLKEAKGGK